MTLSRAEGQGGEDCGEDSWTELANRIGKKDSSHEIRTEDLAQ